MPSPEVEGPPTPSRAIFVDGKKFLWDGAWFETALEAAQQAETYKNNNFEVHLVDLGEKHLVYTRRMVKQVSVPVS
jgi:hypothetical protein